MRKGPARVDDAEFVLVEVPTVGYSDMCDKKVKRVKYASNSWGLDVDILCLKEGNVSVVNGGGRKRVENYDQL